MYGAYQAGAWRALADVFQPDLIVGASIGAINGWAIAGGCGPDRLIQRWITLAEAGQYSWKWPRSFFQGCLDTTRLQQVIRETFESFQPTIDFAVVLTDLLKLRPCIFRGAEIGFEHLVATTAIIGLFDQVRIRGRIYSDGGLLSACPVWAAAELGATRAVVIDVLPQAPGTVAKVFVGAMHRLSSFRPVVRSGVEVIRIGPKSLLGPPLTCLRWNRTNVEQWIEAGERDALRMKHSVADCFERK